jgi:Nucleotidyltransferase of unknown function (DUF6036)
VSDRLFDREALLELLRELADRLSRQGVRANIYVVGSDAMSLSFDARCATRDIDAMVLHGHDVLMDEVRAMARLHDLPSTWLDEQAVMYVSRTVDPEPSAVFDHPFLTVAATSAEHLLAMKLAASRGGDVGDIKILLEVCGCLSLADAEAVYRRVFEGGDLSDRARLIVEDLLGEDR